MAAITSESIFGPGGESSEQARRKAVLVKAAKRGIKTRGMRLLQPGDGGGGRSGGSGGDAATRRRTQGSRPSRGARTSGVSAEQRTQGPDGGRFSITRRQKRPRPSAMGDPGGDEGVVFPQGLKGDTGAATGSEFEVAGGSEVDGFPTKRAVGSTAAHFSESPVPPKKRRKRGSSSSSKSRSSSAANSASNHGGLAAIASLY